MDLYMCLLDDLRNANHKEAAYLKPYMLLPYFGIRPNHMFAKPNDEISVKIGANLIIAQHIYFDSVC